MMFTEAGSALLASIVKLPALRAAIHKNASGLPSGVRKIRLEAARTLGQALSLWQGPALADFRYERFAQGCR